MAITIVAPCGLICDLCLGFQRKKNKCPGCTGEWARPCSILKCPERQGDLAKPCNACAKFPCKRLKSLEKRYSEKYGESLMENFRKIGALGLDGFLLEAEAEWTCPGCSALICVHRPDCPACNAPNSHYKATRPAR